MTTDYATRRDTAITDVLAAIDAVTTPRCGTCDVELHPGGPSPWWCSEPCQTAWQQTTLPRPEADTHRPATARYLLERMAADLAAADLPPLTADQLADASIEASIRDASPLERLAADLDAAILPPAARPPLERWAAPYRVIPDEVWQRCVQQSAPLADAVEDTLHVQLTPWQRLLHTLTAGIRRIRPGRTR